MYELQIGVTSLSPPPLPQPTSVPIMPPKKSASTPVRPRGRYTPACDLCGKRKSKCGGEPGSICGPCRHSGRGAMVGFAFLVIECVTDVARYSVPGKHSLPDGIGARISSPTLSQSRPRLSATWSFNTTSTHANSKLSSIITSKRTLYPSPRIFVLNDPKIQTIF